MGVAGPRCGAPTWYLRDTSDTLTVSLVSRFVVFQLKICFQLQNSTHKILSTLSKKKFVGCFCNFIENKEQKYPQGCAALPLHTSSMHHVGWDVPTTWLASMRKFRRLTCLQKVWLLTLHVGTKTDHELCVELTLERRTFSFCSSPPIRRWRWSSQREATPKQSA